jgi:heptose-I-phosphate ethanolaminephosphotransferase
MIFHLSGQHFLAKNQYPQEKKYDVFSAKDVKDAAPYLNAESRQRIAEYANATRYNDKVIHQIIEMVRHTNSILIYFPDHGEEVYDYRDFYGRQIFSEDKITDNLIKYQLEIPFVVWCSDTWREKHPQEYENIKQAIDRVFTTDNICHMLFRLAGIKTKAYNSTSDLLSPDFKPQNKAYDINSL